MATIGQQLLAPEAGWKRIEDSDNSIKTTGSWSTDLNNGSGGKNIAGNGANCTAKFNFTGTSFRLISYSSSGAYSNNAVIIIDDIAHSVSFAYDIGYQTLVFEQIGLDNKEHCVILTTGSDVNKYIGLDAVDIDSNGEVKLYNPWLSKTKTSLSDMKIGDRIPFHYKAIAFNIGVIDQLGTSTAPEIPVASSAAPDGTAYFYHAGYDLQGRIKLIADRNIQRSISWDALNNAGVASGSGLPISIDGKDGYTIRLLTGGISATDKDNEWDKIIVKSTLNGAITAGDNSVWNLQNIYSLCSTTQIDSNTLRTGRGYSDASRMANGEVLSSAIGGGYGFRPVLLVDVKSSSIKIDSVTPTHMYKNNSPCIINASIISEDPAVTCKFKLSINGVEDAMYMDEIPTVPYDKLKAGPNTVTVLASASDGTLCSAAVIIIKEEDHRTKVERTFTSIDGGYILNNIKLDNNAKAIN